MDRSSLISNFLLFLFILMIGMLLVHLGAPPPSATAGAPTARAALPQTTAGLPADLK
ncbi:MAG: hypothetical protein WBA12_09930 [Catalinimonas sp.]